MNTAEFCVYELIDPRNNEVRYVGKADFSADRLKSHVYSSRHRAKTHSQKWILSLLKENLRPDMRVIQKCFSSENAMEAEKYWIKEYRLRGYNLCNHTDGGEGSTGMRHSEEAKIKIRDANRAIVRSESWKHNHREATKISNARPETRAKRSATLMGHVVSQATKDKMKATRNRKAAEKLKGIHHA